MKWEVRLGINWGVTNPLSSEKYVTDLVFEGDYQCIPANEEEEEGEKGMMTQLVYPASSWVCEGCGGRNERTRRNCN